MAISITGPDGSTFDFPDGTDHGTITSAMQKHYGAPKDASLGAASDVVTTRSTSEPPEVRNIREGFRAQGPVKIASGNLMGLTDEINSAGAAGIDRLLGRTDDWNERRKQYRQAFKEERGDAEKQLGGLGTFAADFVGGMAASPFKAVGPARDMVPAIPLPTIGKLTPMAPATNATQAILNPVVNTLQNLPTLMKTGAAYGGVSGFIGSPEDDASSRIRNAGYTAMGGAALMPGMHLGLSAAGSILPGIAGTARNAFEHVTGTTPAQRATALARKNELLDAGLKSEEIYGPFLKDDGGTWFSKSIANSPAGYQRATGAADRHLAALERNLSNELDATGAPRNRYAAADERQKFLDRQVNQYSMPPERIQFAADEDLARWADPLTGHLRGPNVQPEPPPQAASRAQQPEPPPPRAETAPAFMQPPPLKPMPRGAETLRMITPEGPSAETAPRFLQRSAQEKMALERQAAPLEGEVIPPEPPKRDLPQPPPQSEMPLPEALTYKDRTAAMYEQQNRLIPGQARGGMGTARQSHASDQEITSLIEDIRRNARAEGRLTGDKPGTHYTQSPVADQIEKEVRRHLPSDLVTSLFNTQGVGPAPRQMTRFRTAVRDADTSNPMTRTTTQTWLPRAENALTQDIEARLSRLDDGGAALAHWQNSNKQYRALKEDLVAPLKKVIGENVKPEQAFDKLASAMKGKDLEMIRAYAEAHRWGGQQTEGAGALVSHLMEGGVGNFVKEFQSFTPQAKAELFKGQARGLGDALERYVRLAEPAVAARDSMSWRRFNTHNAGLGAAYMMFDITGTLTAALGQYGAARFLSSPAYVNWITRAAPRVATGGQNAWRHQLMLLGTLADADNTDRGKEVVKAVSRMLTPPPAKAEPDMEMAQ